ncbi:TolC family protein [Gracilimonas mengyeensis]|uniref:Outer membrane protein n=1 Tax=Gracilimonas mengyeensis TaxID=1302730 RepID=A0A521E9U7_9BACT|nr:TolC family protein [Gracilimonas mengyeensis]SMO80221.1 outer membrane protein [Gracilimonas mengyeensis]
MKRILSSTFFVLASLLLIQPSATAQDVRTITLQEAIDIALENNYQLKQAKNNLDLANADIKSEYADFLPSVSGSFGGSRTSGQQFVEDLVSFVDVTSKGMSGRVGAQLTIFDGFNNINSLRQSQQAKLSYEEQVQRAREEVIFNTASRYLQVLLDIELLEIAKQNLENSTKQLEQVQAQVEVGSRPTVDLYNQEAQVANDELSVTQQENSLKFSKLVLIRQLQIDPLGEYEFETPAVESQVQKSINATYNINELIDQALLNRSDLKSEIANIKSLQYQLKIAQGSLYPTISASADISSRYSDQYAIRNENDEFVEVDFSDQFFDQQVNRSIGFSINVPIFQNWNRMNSIQSAKIQLKNAELSYDNSKLQVIQEVAQAYNDYTSYVKQLDAAEKSLRASEKAFETQQERYNVGSSTLIELSDAQASYVTAQSDYTQAIFNLIFQEKLLDYYLGKLNGETVSFN